MVEVRTRSALLERWQFKTPCSSRPAHTCLFWRKSIDVSIVHLAQLRWRLTKHSWARLKLELELPDLLGCMSEALPPPSCF